ncbi:unnamed protein product [Sphagnum jensenii]|uniref:Uncharacterized protein n=2 Tax=Sphagnum jensenii TaxID=128206 RepID=A0ABP0WQD2_9BRYO
MESVSRNAWRSPTVGRSPAGAASPLSESSLSCVSHLVAEEDEDEEDTEAHDAVTALVEQSPLLLPTPLSLVTDATSAAAAVVPRLPFLLQTKMVSEGGSPDASSVFSNIPPRPNRVGKPATTSKYSELHWEGHFDEEKQIAIPDSVNTFHVYLAGSQGPVLFCLHDGGYTGLSFTLVAGKTREKVRVVAMDRVNVSKLIRIHLETQCQDVVNVIKEMYGHETPAMILVGHSMGGAVAVRVAAKRALPTLAGLVVVDVVEGTAMASLVHMQYILTHRQLHFPSVEKVVEWSVRGGGALRNVDSAHISHWCCSYVWQTHLEHSETYWRGWYEGLSEVFLSCPVPKLLLLAGTDRLDRNLTEDVPDEFANVMLNFVSQNHIGAHGVEIPGLRRPITLRSAN